MLIFPCESYAFSRGFEFFGFIHRNLTDIIVTVMLKSFQCTRHSVQDILPEKETSKVFP